MTTRLIISAAALAAICFYAAVRLRYELQMMQQNSYRAGRYLRWLRGDLASVARVTDVLMLAVLILFRGNRWELYAVAFMGALALYKGIRELMAKYKKPLVFTARAVRLYSVGLLLILLAVGLTAWFLGREALFAAMGAALFSPLVILLSLLLLSPVEAAINRWYVNDARRILREMPHLKIIGITGSYGKTSTKNYLYRILSERFNVVMTPGSYNTLLGVVRTVRQHLKAYHNVFIVEMGAKQRGDIAEICNLVHPSMGIITAVGPQHLESFKSIENVRRTKFELIDSLPADGTAILNDDFEYIANCPVTNVEQVFRYTSGRNADGGFNLVSGEPNVDYSLTDVSYGRGETTFAIETPEGKTAPFTTKLAGIHNLSNLLACYIAGRTLGMTNREMRYAIGEIEQVEHRLSIKRMPGGITVIDDAFNSNPHGAAMALDVLAGFTGGRRIVVTPGMIELGAKQAEYNREFGRRMASSCDLAIVVGEYYRAAILAGFEEALAEMGEKNSAVAVATTARDFAAASQKVRETVKPGDVVLYENDLPDTFK